MPARSPEPVRGRALPLTVRERGGARERARDQRLDRRGRDHGPAPSRAARRRGAVPSRERAHPARHTQPGELPRARAGRRARGRSGAMTLSAEPRPAEPRPAEPSVALRAPLERLLEGRDLGLHEAEEALAELMAEATPRSLQAAFLAALR